MAKFKELHIQWLQQKELAQSNPKPTILSILNPNIPPCFEAILKYLSIPDMLRLFGTCRTIHEISYYYFDINALLRPFFPNPLIFRQAMADNNLIFAGSLALKFFTRDDFATKDIDVYTDSLISIRKTAKVLEAEGFRFEPFEWHSKTLEASLANVAGARDRIKSISKNFDVDVVWKDNAVFKVYEGAQIGDVYRFEKDNGLHIDLILTRGPALKAIIAGYYATYIMNFVTYNKAYNLFPYHTVLHKNGFQSVGEMSQKRDEAVEKYKKRGYEVIRYGKLHECAIGCPIRPHRRVGDIFTWTIELPVDGIRIPATSMIPENNTFGIKAHDAHLDPGSQTRFYEAQSALVFNMESLQIKYLEFPILVDTQTGSWKEFLYYMLSKAMTQEASDARDEVVPDPWLQKETIISGRKKVFDADVREYYRFWYEYVMPGEALWKGQYPRLQ